MATLWRFSRPNWNGTQLLYEWRVCACAQLEVKTMGKIDGKITVSSMEQHVLLCSVTWRLEGCLARLRWSNTGVRTRTHRGNLRASRGLALSLTPPALPRILVLGKNTRRWERKA